MHTHSTSPLGRSGRFLQARRLRQRAQGNNGNKKYLNDS